MHTQEEIKNILERHFKEISDVYGIEMAFLYGSWERGYPKKSSDVDSVVVLAEMSDEDEVFKRSIEIAVSLVKKSGLEVNVNVRARFRY